MHQRVHKAMGLLACAESYLILGIAIVAPCQGLGWTRGSINIEDWLLYYLD